MAVTTSEQDADEQATQEQASASVNANSPENAPAEAEPTAATAASDATAPSDAAPTPDSAPEPEPGPESAPETAAKPAPKAAANPEPTLKALEENTAQISHKNTANLNSLRNKLNKLRKTLTDEQSELQARADKLHEKIQQLSARNQEHQAHLHDATAKLIETLKAALDAGQSHDALPTWDRIQGNISNTSGKVRSALQDMIAPFKGQLNELRDWKVFAATEKKRELIQHMQHLIDTKMSPQDLNKRIAEIHKEWKALGRSNDNDKLWKEFKALSDKAYEPCKEYFKQRKQLMAENLKHRRTLCEDMQAELDKVDPDNIHIGEINKLLSRAEKHWKKHAPVEQSKIKTLQKRYYGLVNEFRAHRKTAIKDNASRKQALIDAATALATSEDNRQAMEEAKKLQKQWKEIGPTTFKDDKKYWADFRSACDRIFAERDEQNAERKQKQKQTEQELHKILADLEGILKLDDAAFRDAKADFHTLAQQFNSALDSKQRNARNKLVDRFNDLKRRLDSRFQALPDKKTQASLAALDALCQALEPAEEALLDSSASTDPVSTLATLDKDVWTALDVLDDDSLIELLKKRQSSLAADALEAFRADADAAEKALRTLCIETEIRAGVDTPQEDQGRRMELQLAQLQEGLGQARPSRKENIHYARLAEMRARCIGPLSRSTREQLQARLLQATERLR